MNNIKINSLFKSYSSITPGCAIGVTKGNKLLFKTSFGLANVQEKIPITSSTPFRLASLTKPFTAMSIMLLKEQGKLHYDDSLKSFFSNLPLFLENVTLRQLMTHTAGIPDHEKLLYKQISIGDEPTIYDSLKVLSQRKRLLFNPEKKYKYSDAGFVLLALVIEKVSKQKYAAFLKKNIFDPLLLTNTFVMDETKPVYPKRAIGYRKKYNHYEIYDYDPLNYIIGDEGIFSSVNDLSKWQKAWTSEILVKEETLKEALSLSQLQDGRKGKCGFSWFITKDYIYHDGFWVGFNNIMLYEKKSDISIVLLSNTNDFLGEKNKMATAVSILRNFN